MTGEERERRMLDDQIARAKADAEAAEKDHIPAELQKRDGEKISLNLFGPSTTSTPAATGEATSAPEAGPSKPSFSFGSISTATPSATIANPLKRPAPVNIFKSSKPKTDSDAPAPIKQKQLSEVERLMKEDQARKMNRGGYQGHGPRRG